TGESRRGVGDATAIVHQRQQLLRQEENAFEVNVDHSIEVRFGHFLEVDVLRITGVVHEVIESFASPALQRLAHSRHEVVERADIARVELQGDGLGSRLTGERSYLLSLGAIGVVGEDRMDAALGKTEHGAAAEAATSAGDDRNGG